MPVKYVRRRSLPGKKFRKSKRCSRIFLRRELREEAAEWELYKISACAPSFDGNSSSAAFLRALSRPYQPPQIENRIRNGAAIIIHPPRLQTFPAIKPSTEV